MQSGFNSELLSEEGTAQNEQVITHLLLGVNAVGSCESLVWSCPFNYHDTASGIIHRRCNALMTPCLNLRTKHTTTGTTKK